MRDSLSRTFLALADPTRRAILAQLSGGAATVNEIVEAHDLSQPNISKHIKVLEEAGLIRREKVARTRPCVLQPEGLDQAAGWIDRYRTGWTESFDRLEASLKDIYRKGPPDA